MTISISFSQIGINPKRVGNDYLLTAPEMKQVIKNEYKIQELDSLNLICETKNIIYKKQLSVKDTTINRLESIVKLEQQKFTQQQQISEEYKAKYTLAEKERKKNKRRSMFIGLGTGISFTCNIALLTYIILRK